MTSIGRDGRLVIAGQAVRAFAYGLTSVLLGVTLDRLGFSGWEAGLVLTSVVAGAAIASIAVARFTPRFGRRFCYVALYGLLGISGLIFAFADSAWVLAIGGLVGALSTDVVESGPFTSLEQAMIAEDVPVPRLASGFGVYNAVATICGALGALAAALPSLTASWLDVSPQRWFLLLVIAALAGVTIATRLSVRVEVPGQAPGLPAPTGLGASRPVVTRLSALFAVDAFGGGFVVQSFIAFWFAQKFGVSTGAIGVVFFAVGIVQAVSFIAAPLLARRIGLLPTMVATHLPSNALLIALAFAPTFGAAAALLLARSLLSQMDVPTRQAYVMTLVPPEARVPAAVYSNTARYVVRPVGPALAGVTQSIALGAPFVIGGAVKSVYDVVLWCWFRRVPITAPTSLEAT